MQMYYIFFLEGHYFLDIQYLKEIDIDEIPEVFRVKGGIVLINDL